MGWQNDHVLTYSGCGHNGLALRQRTFSCVPESMAHLELDMTGKQLRRWDADK